MAMPNLVEIRQSGASRQWVKYNEFLNLFIPFFMNSPTCQTCRRIFTLDGSNDEDSHLLGVSLILLPFRGWSPPKTPIFGTCIGVFKPIGQNTENYCINFNQILHNDRDHQVVIVGGPNRRLTNPRWRTAAILKTDISSMVWPIFTKFGMLMQNWSLNRSNH